MKSSLSHGSFNFLLRFVFFSPQMETVQPADGNRRARIRGLFSPRLRAEENEAQQKLNELQQNINN